MNLPEQPGKIWVEGLERSDTPTQPSRFALSELAEDWHFFNHGALFTYGGMPYPKQDPVADWFAQQPKGAEVIMQPFKRMLIEGLDAPLNVVNAANLTWGHVVMAVRHEFWDSLFAYLGGVATVDYKQKKYAQTFSGDIQMLDPVLAEHAGLLDPSVPQITLTVFCVDTNTDRWEIRPPRTAVACPRFVRVPPRDEVVQLGRAVLSGELDELQYKDNPAFQPMLEKYKALTGGRERGCPPRTSGGP